MTDTANAQTDARTIRLKKIAFRASHRGMKEMDILLSKFMAHRLESMTEQELDMFEAMMFIPDQDFFKMLMEDMPVPSEVDGPLMRELIDFTQNR